MLNPSQKKLSRDVMWQPPRKLASLGGKGEDPDIEDQCKSQEEKMKHSCCKENLRREKVGHYGEKVSLINLNEKSLPGVKPYEYRVRGKVFTDRSPPNRYTRYHNGHELFEYQKYR